MGTTSVGIVGTVPAIRRDPWDVVKGVMTMIQRRVTLRAIVAAAAVLVGGNAARADVTWVLQPSSNFGFDGQFGSINSDSNGNPITLPNGSYSFSELYNAVPQTNSNSPGTSLNPGFTNSMVTSLTGTYTTTGNTFLSVLNFGSEPATPVTNPTVTFANNGTWLPNGPTAGPFPGSFGAATPGNAAFALTFVGGTDQPPLANNGDGGRVQVFGTSGAVSSNNNTTPVTNGSFNANILVFTGSINLAVNFNGNDSQEVISLGDTGSVSVPSTTNAPGTITRGVGANSYQYVMTSSLPANLNGTTPQNGTTLYFNVNLNSTITAVANLAKGDVNFDGVVNGLDISLVSSNWNTLNAQHLGPGDANGDGVVNGLDISLISSNWNATTPPLGGAGGSGSAVPEPGTWVLLGLGSLGLWVMRKRSRR
jgi:hypothetical protein